MKDKIFAYLQLMRFPNIFTSIADVLAGCLIAEGFGMGGWALLMLILSTSFIYAGGCILNDIRDRATDAAERPQRPIPSGRVSVKEAKGFLILCFALGLFTAYQAGGPCFGVAVVLVFLAVFYDVVTKKMAVLGPINMGACRGANLLLGMSLSFDWPGSAFLYPIISFIYVFALTTLSHFEVTGGLSGRGRVVWGPLVLVILFILGLNMTGQLGADSLIYTGLLVTFAAPFVMGALLEPKPQRVGKGVKYLILGIPLLDAVYVSGVHGWVHAIPVALCLVPSMFLSRYLYVT